MATGRDAFGNLTPLTYTKPGLATCQYHTIVSSCWSESVEFGRDSDGDVTGYCAEHSSILHSCPGQFEIISREEAMESDTGTKKVTIW